MTDRSYFRKLDKHKLINFSNLKDIPDDLFYNEEFILSRLMNKIEMERMKIRDPKGRHQLPSVQEIINLISITKKYSPNSFNILDPNKFDADKRYNEFIRESKKNEIYKLQLDDFNYSQQKKIEKKTPDELLNQLENALSSTMYSQFAQS